MAESCRSPITMDTLVELSDGIPGAISVLVECMNGGHQSTVLRLKDLGIRGSAIWILYKDRCKCDLQKMVEMVAVTPDNELPQLSVDSR